jgi:serine/threonine protein kinase
MSAAGGRGGDGWLFIVMDYLEGRDLDRLLLDEGNPGLSWTRTLELLKPLADGLDYAHAQHVIHRDLKPGNVFITHEGEVKLLDFGLAYRLHRSSSQVHVQENSSSGTAQYMPPGAFVAGAPDKAQDIYALACLAYEMLTGEPPYSPEAAIQRRPDWMPAKPEALTEAAWEELQSGLAYHKENRPESAGELVRSLEVAQAITPEIRKLEEGSAQETVAPKLRSEKDPEHPPGESGRPWRLGLVLLVMGGGVLFLIFSAFNGLRDGEVPAVSSPESRKKSEAEDSSAQPAVACVSWDDAMAYIEWLS